MSHTRITSRSDLRLFQKADLQANGLSKWRWFLRFSRPQVHFLRLLRRAEYWSTRHGASRIIYMVSRFLLARRSQQLGISIPPGVFGPGLSLPHYGTIVVNDKARFGSYCRLHCNTNIGEVAGEAPAAGDFVYIAPGAVIYGGIKIGDAAAIGANAVVGADVPPTVTVAGAPARVVSPRGARGAMPSYLVELMPD